MKKTILILAVGISSILSGLKPSSPYPQRDGAEVLSPLTTEALAFIPTCPKRGPAALAFIPTFPKRGPAALAFIPTFPKRGPETLAFDAAC